MAGKKMELLKVENQPANAVRKTIHRFWRVLNAEKAFNRLLWSLTSVVDAASWSVPFRFSESSEVWIAVAIFVVDQTCASASR